MQAIETLYGDEIRGGRVSLFGDLGRKLLAGLSSVFGCRHAEMSRPVTSDGETYRACLGCGAHRRFDLKRWKSSGPFYYVRAAETGGH
ncbi:MAG: hypothetical protein ACRD68_14730 [Pyrinomonadaceae bacterium]